MELIEYLKQSNARVSLFDIWLVWWGDEWVVLEREYGARKNTTLYRGDSIEDAVEAMRQSEGSCYE